MTRITQRAIALTSLQGLNSNLAALNKLQQQLTSGKTISQPSDDPTGTNTSMITRQEHGRGAQQARNITDGTALLDATDSALQNMLDQVQQVRDLTVQALNTGAHRPTSHAGDRHPGGGHPGEPARPGQPGRAGPAALRRRRPPGPCLRRAPAPTSGVGGGTGIAVVPVTRQVSDVEPIRVDITGPEAFGDPASGQGPVRRGRRHRRPRRVATRPR